MEDMLAGNAGFPDASKKPGKSLFMGLAEAESLVGQAVERGASRADGRDKSWDKGGIFGGTNANTYVTIFNAYVPSGDFLLLICSLLLLICSIDKGKCLITKRDDPKGVDRLEYRKK